MKAYEITKPSKISKTFYLQYIILIHKNTAILNSQILINTN